MPCERHSEYLHWRLTVKRQPNPLWGLPMQKSTTLAALLSTSNGLSGSGGSHVAELSERLARAAGTVTGQHRLRVSWAHSEVELREAQRWRYRVFADEMGAHLKGPAGLDVDAFDAFCDHLLVRDLDTLKVVGTYRVLPPHRAEQIGRLYSEGEF